MVCSRANLCNNWCIFWLSESTKTRLASLCIHKGILFDSSNAVLGIAFTPPPLEKVIAFCTAETNFVLHNKQNKVVIISKQKQSRPKTSKVVKMAGKSRRKIFHKRREKSYQNKNKDVLKPLKFSKKVGKSCHDKTKTKSFDSSKLS